MEHAPRPTPLQASGAALSYRLAEGVATARLYFRKTIPTRTSHTPLSLIGFTRARIHRQSASRSCYFDPRLYSMEVTPAREFAAWALEWNRSLTVLHRAMSSAACAEACGRHVETGCLRKRSLACRRCALCEENGLPVQPQQPSMPRAGSCSLVAYRHVAKTGGVHSRVMLQLDKEARARFYGLTYYGWTSRSLHRRHGKFLFCCDPRSDTECKPVQLTEARSLAIRQLASPPASATAAAGRRPQSAQRPARAR